MSSPLQQREPGSDSTGGQPLALSQAAASEQTHLHRRQGAWRRDNKQLVVVIAREFLICCQSSWEDRAFKMHLPHRVRWGGGDNSSLAATRLRLLRLSPQAGYLCPRHQVHTDLGTWRSQRPKNDDTPSLFEVEKPEFGSDKLCEAERPKERDQTLTDTCRHFKG